MRAHGLALLAALLVAAPAGAEPGVAAAPGVAAPPASAERAAPSRLTAESLLVGVARAGDRLVAVGEWGHVVLSDDAGATWRQAASVPTSRTLTDVAFANEREGWAVGHDAQVLHTADGGERWDVQFASPEDEAPLLSVWFEDARRGIAVGGFGLFLETRDGGESWERRRLGGDEDEAPHLNHVFPGPRDTLFIAAEFGSVFRSRDDAASWERLRLPYEGSLWSGLAVDESVLVLGMRGHLFRSDDLGETWHPVESHTDQSLQSATRLRDGGVVAVGLGGVVLRSADASLAFRATVQPDRRGIADVAEGAPGAVLLFGESGVTTPVESEP